MKAALAFLLFIAIVFNVTIAAINLSSMSDLRSQNALLKAQLKESEAYGVLSEIRAVQALDELHAMQAGTPRKAYEPKAEAVLPDTPAPAEPLIESNAPE